MPAEKYVSTYQVASALGVSVSTVKRWVDEGILPAHKTAGGHRKLLAADVLRLVRDSHFPRADLSELNLDGQPGDPQAISRDLFEAMRDGRQDAVAAAIAGAYESGQAVGIIADDIIAPAMHRLGHEWEIGRIDVIHEHRGTDLCMAALHQLRAQIEANAEKIRPVAIGGCPEHDPYIIASFLAQLVLIDTGWNAVNLGPHTPVSAFERAIKEFEPRIIWISASYLVEPAAFAEEYRKLYRLAERTGVAVAVGGQALTEEIRRELPYSTYGDGLAHLAAFARSVNPRPRKPRRGRPPGTAKKT